MLASLVNHFAQYQNFWLFVASIIKLSDIENVIFFVSNCILDTYYKYSL